MSTQQTRITTTCSLLLTAVLCPGLSADAQQQANQGADQPQAPAIEETRFALDRWKEIRQTIAKERADWALAKQDMLDRIDLLKGEIRKVNEEIEKQKETLAKFDTSIEELEARNEKLKQASEKLERLVEAMEARTLALLDKAPLPLVEQVKPLAVQLTGYSSGTKPAAEDSDAQDNKAESPEAETEQGEEEKKNAVPLARSVENVVGVLYMFNKFSGKIEQKPELVELSDGSSLSVDTLYLGLSYGFYVDDSDTKGAGGWGGPDGWAWNPIESPDAAALIRKAISVYNKDEPAAFVGLPLEVQE